jgi:hypothetical protein
MNREGLMSTFYDLPNTPSPGQACGGGAKNQVLARQ